MESKKIIELFEKSEEELFLQLAQEDTSGAFGIDPIEKGKEMYKNISNFISKEICTNSKIKSLFDEKKGYNKLILAAAISDIIAQLGIPVSPFTVAVLCVKEGLKSVCKSYWDE